MLIAVAITEKYVLRGMGWLGYGSPIEVEGVSFFVPHAFIMGGASHSAGGEYQYADGAYNAKQFDDDEQRPQDNPVTDIVKTQ